MVKQINEWDIFKIKVVFFIILLISIEFFFPFKDCSNKNLHE
jgi:hypothetical protein